MKISKSRISILVSLIIGLISSCSDMYEQDISKKTVDLIAPMDSLQTALLDHHFWWEQTDGAESYEIAIVRGEFSAAVQLITDTVIQENSYFQSLSPGQFQWRVKALNNAYESPYSTNSLFIDSTVIVSDSVDVKIMLYHE